MPNEHNDTAHPKMTRWAKIAGLLFLAVLAFIVLPEMLFACFYFLQDGRWVSVSDRLKGTQNIYVGEFNGNGCRYIDALYPHPYLAFVFHNNSPCRQTKEGVVKGSVKPANTEGFLEDRDFPLERAQDSFDILLLGGSVTQQFGQAFEGGPNFLESVLNRCFTPPHGTRFQVFNGAAGAWKQPQEAITFLLYGRGFSGVVSVEGFNEMQILFSNAVRLELPGNNFAAINPFAAQTYRSVVLAFLTNQMLAWAQTTWVGSHSYMAYFVVDRVRMILKNHARVRDQRQRTSVDTLFSLPEAWSPNDRIAFNTLQYDWYINAIDEVARRNGIDYAVFMQPAPAIDKPLTPAEKAVVGDLSYGKRYFQLTRDLMEMAKERQTHLYSLLPIFKDVHETIYADHIHPDNHGGEVPAYRLMAWHIAHRLASAWSFEQSGRCKNDVASAGLPETYEKALLSMDLSTGSDVTINVGEHRH